MRTNFLPLCMPAYRVHDVIMHSHLLRLSAAAAGAAPALQTVEWNGMRTEDDAGRNRNAVAKCQSPKASVRAVCHIVWPDPGGPSWSMDNLASDSRRTWWHALGLGWSSSSSASRQEGGVGQGKKHQQKQQQQQQLQSTTISYCWQKFVKICIANF